MKGTVHMKTVKVSVIGGDRRMFFCAEALYDKNIEPALYGFDKISDRANSTRCASLADCLLESSAVILPLPLSKDGKNITSSSDRVIGLAEVFSKVQPETPIFAGLVSDDVKALAQKYGHFIFDYYDNETLTKKNAYATAEGAISLAMKNSDVTIFGAKCLVAGYGRIGKYTARLLSGFGAQVTVCARKSSARTEAELCGFGTADFEGLSGNVRDYGFIFNTVPAQVFTEGLLSKMSSSQCYIELASAPYGIDKNAAKKYNIEIIDGAALPSRYCPKSAGEYIADEISAELERMGII